MCELRMLYVLAYCDGHLHTGFTREMGWLIYFGVVRHLRINIEIKN